MGGWYGKCTWGQVHCPDRLTNRISSIIRFLKNNWDDKPVPMSLIPMSLIARNY